MVVMVVVVGTLQSHAFLDQQANDAISIENKVCTRSIP